ncbi:MAG TPA: hypothetical protein VMV46_03645, partial [Thermoanaerobaculia bacterium]|nr:hypothetical protein [Thermoanaerobaculia bacterium]
FRGTVSLSNSYDEPSDGYFTQPRFDGQCEPGLLTGRRYGSEVSAHDDRWRIVLLHASCSLEIELEGEIGFAPDDRGIARMGRGSKIPIEERANTTRELVITPGSDGEPQHRWRVDGDDRPFDAEARRWLAGALPEVFRTTGLRAPERVARLLESGGVPAVLEEIRRMSSDHVQSLYFAEVLGQARPSAEEAEAVLGAAGETLGSDHALAELLSRFPSERLADLGVQRAFVRAASTIGSDYEAARVLRAILERGDLASEILDAVMAITGDIGSDYERTGVLMAVLHAHPPDRPVPRTLVAAAETIGSDYERGRLLRAVIDRERLDDATVEALLRSAEGIGSDHERAELLVRLARRVELDGRLRERYLEAARGIGSRYDYERTLAAVGETARGGR